LIRGRAEAIENASDSRGGRYPEKHNGTGAGFPPEVKRVGSRRLCRDASSLPSGTSSEATRPHATLVGAVAQLGERRFCKPEAVGSIPISSTMLDR
jgi:hypothetical protein